MCLLPDTQNCGLRMRRECRKRISRHRFLRKLLFSDSGRHHGTCVTHVPWCMSASLTRGSGENVPGILGACATRNFTYLARGPFSFKMRARTYRTMLVIIIPWFFVTALLDCSWYLNCLLECVASSINNILHIKIMKINPNTYEVGKEQSCRTPIQALTWFIMALYRCR